MKKSIYIILALMGILTMNSCNDDEFLAGNPDMELMAGKVSALYGDSLPFTIKASDVDVPLSTLKARLFYGEELVSETVIRTKTSGEDYTGKVFVPYYPAVIDGRATLKFVLQNIHFTITEMEQQVALSRPDFPYLTLVDDKGEEYLMKKTSLYNYSVTGRFPQDLKAYFKTPKVGENGNELTFGWDNDNLVAEGRNVNPITFAGTESEAFEVTFNTLTYEVGPLQKVTFDGEDMVAVDATTFRIEKTFTQGQSIAVGGIELNDWWINPDYFTKDDNGVLTFLPVDGKYRVMANVAQKYFGVTRMNGDNDATLSADGHGAIWLMGWGVGSPSLDYQFGWNEGNNYSVPEVSSKKYQFTGVAGPEHGSVIGQRIRTDYLGFKFFHQNGWGGEFSKNNRLTVAENSKSLIKVVDDGGNDDGNILLADGAILEEGATYILTVDLTEGNNKGIVSLEKISGGEVKPKPTVVQTLYFDFGSITNTQGSITEGPDVNNNYWNNITNNVAGNKYAEVGTTYSPLVNSENAQTTYILTLDVRFSTNGKSGGGGLLAPQEELLGDLAVASATEDYFFTESNENENRSFTFSGLDKDKGYKFYIFGSRSTTQKRVVYYIMSGFNSYQGELQTSGTDCGGTGIHQNNQNICESELIFPDDEGKIKFTLAKETGTAYAALNAMKIEEYTNVSR